MQKPASCLREVQRQKNFWTTMLMPNTRREKRQREWKGMKTNSRLGFGGCENIGIQFRSVLSTPKGAGPFFYVRKLAIYDFTIYNLGNSSVQCFIWLREKGGASKFPLAFSSTSCPTPTLNMWKWCPTAVEVSKRTLHFLPCASTLSTLTQRWKPSITYSSSQATVTWNVTPFIPK